MVTFQQLLNTPRAILNDFKVVFLSIGNFIIGFWRGYTAFFMEIRDDIKKHLSPFFSRTLYRAILNDFRAMFQSTKTQAVTFWTANWSTILALLPNRKKIFLTVSYITKSVAPTAQKTTVQRTGVHGFIYDFFLKYRALLYEIYNELVEADKTNELPSYLITSSIIIFIFGCILFYLIMVFGV